MNTSSSQLHSGELCAGNSVPRPYCSYERRSSRRRAVAHCLATVASPALAQNAPARTVPRPVQRQQQVQGPAVYVALESDVLTPQSTLSYEEALQVGLKALKLLGITGLTVDVLWGLVEKKPREYNWSGYAVLFKLIVDMGFKLQVNLCFNSTDTVALPEWIHELGAQHPDIWFTDKSGDKQTDCLTVGVDDVPCLLGRTGVQVYQDVMQSFKHEFQSLLGTEITEIVIGLGPRTELRYPSHPADPKRWEFPGVGEFQCYDRYMLGNLKACAEQVRQPPWGLGGPHDAGNYTAWPHDTGFFAHKGNWLSDYGTFFLQWYSELLVQHAQRVMTAAGEVFDGSGVALSARAPGAHWWYNTSSHAAELTCGYYSTVNREGYLPAFQVLAQQGAGVHLGLAEARTSEQLASHCADPERLLMTQRTVAAALHLPVTVENSTPRFDEVGLNQIMATLSEPCVNLGIELPPPKALVFNRMSDHMFEPANWQRFKAFVRRVRSLSEGGAAGLPGTPSPAVAQHVG